MDRVETIPPMRVVFDDADRAGILAAIDETLRSGMVASGRHVEAFEAFWAEYSGCRHAVAVANGGSALQLILEGLDVRGRDVLVTTNTFAASVNAILAAGGRPILLDIDPALLGPTPEAVEACCTDSTAGVMLVHIGGMISPAVRPIADWCRDRGLWVVEDAAHAHGSESGGRRAGSFGTAAAYSFFATKVMTSGEGGVIVTDDDALADACRRLRDYGKQSAWESVYSVVSMNHRMGEIPSILGLSQARRLDEFIEARAAVAAKYAEALSDRITLLLPAERSSGYKVIAVLPPGRDRAGFRTELKARGISLSGGVYDVPIHRQPAFEATEVADGAFPNADDFCARHVCLPVFVGMTDDQVQRVIDGVCLLLDGSTAP